MQSISAPMQTALALRTTSPTVNRQPVVVVEFYAHDYVPSPAYDPADAFALFTSASITWLGNTYRRQLSSHGNISKYLTGQFNNVSLGFNNNELYMSALIVANEIEGMQVVVRYIDRTLSATLADSVVLFSSRAERPDSLDELQCSIDAKQEMGSILHEIPKRTFSPIDPEGRSPADPLYEGFKFNPITVSVQVSNLVTKRFFFNLIPKLVQAPITKQWSSEDGSSRDTVVPLVFGQAQVELVPLLWADTGFRFNALMCAAGHKVSYIGPVTVVNPGFVGPFQEHVTRHLGDPGGTGTNAEVDPYFPDSGALLSRTAYCGLTIIGPEDAFGSFPNSTPDALPTMVAIVRGEVDLPDGSGDFTETGFSNNPAYIARFILTSPDLIGLDPQMIDDEECILTAALCDEIIKDDTNAELLVLNTNDTALLQTNELSRFNSAGVLTPNYYKNLRDPLINDPYIAGRDDVLTYDTDTLPTVLPPTVVYRKRYTYSSTLTDKVKAVDFLFNTVLPSFRGYILIGPNGKLKIKTERPADSAFVRGASIIGATSILVSDVEPWRTSLQGLALIGVGLVTSETRTVTAAEYSTAGNSISLTASGSGGVTATASGATLSGGSTSVPASGTITLGGSPVGTITVTIDGVELTYTLATGEDLGSAAAMLATAINAEWKLKSFVRAEYSEPATTPPTVEAGSNPTYELHNATSSGSGQASKSGGLARGYDASATHTTAVSIGQDAFIEFFPGSTTYGASWAVCGGFSPTLDPRSPGQHSQYFSPGLEFGVQFTSDGKVQVFSFDQPVRDVGFWVPGSSTRCRVERRSGVYRVYQDHVEITNFVPPTASATEMYLSVMMGTPTSSIASAKVKLGSIGAVPDTGIGQAGVVTVYSKLGTLTVAALTNAHNALLASPTAAPTPTAAASGSLLAGTYYLAYSFTTAVGETFVSPVASVVLTAGQKIDVASITPLPAGVSQVKWYLSKAPDDQTLAYLITNVGAAFTINVLPDSDASPIPLDNTAGEEVIRVMASFTDKNILDGKFRWPLSESSVNQVVIKYREASDGFAERELIVNDRAHQRKIGKANKIEISGAGIDNFNQASRIANSRLSKEREGNFFCEWDTDEAGIPFEEGDVVCCTDVSGGFVNLPVRLEKVSIHPDSGSGVNVSFTGRLYSTLMYSDQTGQHPIVLPTTLRYLVSPPPVATDLVLTEVGGYSPDLSFNTGIRGDFEFGEFLSRQLARVYLKGPSPTEPADTEYRAVEVVFPNENNHGAFEIRALAVGHYWIKVVTESQFGYKAASGHPEADIILSVPPIPIFKIFDNVPPRDDLYAPGLTIGMAPTGVGKWGGGLIFRDRGYGYERVAQIPNRSPFLPLTTYINDLYLGAYSRDASDAEIASATTALDTGCGDIATLAATKTLIDAVFEDAEYTGLSTSNTQYVTDLYESIMGRGPDAGGLAFWVAILVGGETRANVREAFVYSLEHIIQRMGGWCPNSSNVTMGVTTDNGDVWLADTAGVLYVQLESGTISSLTATEDQIAQGLNNVFVGREKIGVGTWTDLGAGLWQGDDLVRGLEHTYIFQDTHTAEEDFILLDQAITFLPIELRDIGQPITYLFLSYGQSGADGDPIIFTPRGDSIRAFAINSPELTLDASNDLQTQFEGNPRPHEEPETYSQEVWPTTARVDTATIKRTHLITAGTSHAALLYERTNPFTESGNTRKSPHLDKNNYNGSGQAATVEWLTTTNVRVDFNLHWHGADGGVGSISAEAWLYQGRALTPPYTPLVHNVSGIRGVPVVGIRWSAGTNPGTIKESYYKGIDDPGNGAVTVGGDTPQLVTERDNVDPGFGAFRIQDGDAPDAGRPGPRYSFMLSGTEFRLYRNYQSVMAQPPVCIIPSPAGSGTVGMGFPLGLLISVGASFSCRNVVIGGAARLSTIYSRREQIADFGKAVTVDSSTDTFTHTAHGFANDTPVYVDAQTFPGGLSTGTLYYVRDTAADTFKLAASVGGAAINVTSNGTAVVVAAQQDTFHLRIYQNGKYPNVGHGFPVDLDETIV